MYVARWDAVVDKKKYIENSEDFLNKKKLICKSLFELLLSEVSTFDQSHITFLIVYCKMKYSGWQTYKI